MKTSMILLHELCLINDLKYSSNLQEFEEEVRILDSEAKYDYVGSFK